jgi:SAM-dependent methyltransferase
MDHADHVQLLRGGVPHEPGAWADLGAGSGAFTLALADLLPAGSTIAAVDRDAAALRQLESAFSRFARGRAVPTLTIMRADFTKDLDLGRLDGVVMANSLHFVKDKAAVLARVRAALGDGGRFLLVEYDTDRGNDWVPYPLSFGTWQGTAKGNGFTEPVLLHTVPSRFLGRMYAALALARDVKPAEREV